MKRLLAPAAVFTLALAALAAPTSRPRPEAPFDNIPVTAPVTKPYTAKCNLEIYNPRDLDVRKDKRTALVLIHGGGWGGNSPKFWTPQALYFANEGYVVFSVDYRLMSNSVSLFDCVADCKAAVRFVRKNAADFGIDPGKIVAIGDSAGGHLAACTGLIDGLEAEGEDLKISSKPNAMVLFYPVIDLTSPDGWNLKKNSGKPGEAILPRAKEVSPSDHVAKNAPPTLVFHGDKDTIVNVAPVDRFVAAMKAAGNTCEYVRLEGKSHAFVTRGYNDDDAILKLLAQTQTFLIKQGYPPK